MSVSDLSDLTKNVVEEVVWSIDDVVIAEQRANEPRHIRNLTNIMRIAQLTDAQRASEWTDFILSQLPTDIAATIRSNKSAMAYLEEAILEWHYCAQAGKLVVYETDANGVELYKADTNDEVPVFTNRWLEYKWQVLGSGIADAMKVVGIDHNKYTQ
jgi:hypothetical protein